MEREKAANMQPQPWIMIIIFQDKTSGLKSPTTKQDKKKKKKGAQINEWEMNKTQIFNQKNHQLLSSELNIE